MLEANRGQHRHPRRKDVGGVKAPAEPSLDHADLDTGRREGDERGGGVGLELGDRLALVEGAIDGRDRLGDALSRRSEDSGSISAPWI